MSNPSPNMDLAGLLDRGLLPCPFCNTEVYPVLGDHKMAHPYDNCALSGFQTGRDAWNRRASPSPAGGVQGVTGSDLCAAFEHEVTQQTQAYRFKAGSKPGTWLFACDEWIDLSAILSALTAALSSQAQTTGGVE